MDRSPSDAVRAFRARFEGVAEADKADLDREYPTMEARIGYALWLQAYNLAIEWALVRDRLGSVPDEEIAAEINRRRIGSAPLPVPLAERWRRIREDRAR